MPKVFDAYDIRVNRLVEIDLMLASSVTPISSGKGEAIINPAMTGKKYFLSLLGV